MKKVIGKISKKQLDTMIQEELAKMKKLVALKERKEALENQIKVLKETYGLDEVEVSGRKSKGDAYFMQDLPVQSFEKKKNGTEGHSVALKEMEDMSDEECGELETMFAELGRKLDAVLAGQEELADDHEELADDHIELGAEEDGDETIELGDEDEMDSDDDIEDEMEIDESSCDDKYEESEESEFSEEDIVNEEEEEEEEETIDEQEGETVVNAADADKVNANMTKVDNKNPMADKMYESRKPGKKSTNKHQHINPNNNPLINEELERMKRLANL
jgi:hypothetical protein